MNTAKRPQILCVDDEIEVLRALALNLGRRYEVLTAIGGTEALELLHAHPAIAVIISDMRMPGLNGAKFLARSRALAPEAQRILLTGQTDMASAAAAVNEGQISQYLTKPCATAELLRAVEAALERRRVAALEKSAVRKRVECQQLRIDPLTGLASRQQLLAALEAAAYQNTDSDRVPVAFFIEIDSSDEPLNPRNLPWGDELASIVADRLRKHCAGAMIISRSGLEQFVVIESAQARTDSELRARGEELLSALSEPVPVDGECLAVGVSIGIAKLEDCVQWQRLLPQAGAAAREARRTAASTPHLYRPDLLPREKRQRDLLHALRQALDQGGLCVHYQPIIDINAGCVDSFESLARWTHRNLGQIEPSTFIALSEQSGDIVRLGEWVLWQACHEGRQLLGGHDRRLAVNVSAKQLLDRKFLPHLEECLTHSALPPHCLELELTESALVCDMKQMRDVLDEIRKLQVRIAVDDFGTGFSSLSYLSQLPIDVIKVDRIFVRDFHRGGRSIISASLAIARDLGPDVVVEGVETAEMLQQVRDLGASLIQGYWFAQPMGVGPMTDWLRDYEERGAARTLGDVAVAGRSGRIRS